MPDPFSEAGGDRLYRTGDVVRRRADGNIEFVGRIDQQVKIRGFRIELEEVENALLQHTGIERTVVLAREDRPGNRRLVAYVVRNERSGACAADELRAFLKKRLPDYMVPMAFVEMEELPLTPNGKIDRKALPAPEERRSELDLSGPRNGQEELLCAIFAQVLHLPRVGVEEDFFSLGGHSLLATQAISRIREAFAVELPLRVLFEEPAVAGLARRIEEARRAESHSQMTPMRRVDREGPLPLSFAQQRLWFLDQLQPNSSTYNIGYALRLQGELSLPALEEAFTEIVRRHEVLRTRMEALDGEPRQVVVDAAPVLIPVTDLSGLAPADREAEMDRHMREQAEGPFDLARGPLLRLKLLQLAGQEHVLLVTMHHIVSDGWSLGIMAREISRLYEADVLGQESPLPELKFQYADYAAWQREWLQGEVLERQLEYWREQLAQLEPLDLPTDHARPAVMGQRGATRYFVVAAEMMGRLQELSRREGVTLFMGLLAAFQVMLSKYAGQQDIAVGTVVANRNRVEVEELIGFFVNTLVLRTELSGNPSFTEVLKRVRQVTLNAYQHQDVPFEKLVEELHPGRDLGRSPLFQVMLVLQNAGQRELHMPGLRLNGSAAESSVAKFDLQLTLSESAEGLTGELSYALDLYEAETMDRLVDHLRLVLEQTVEEPEQRIGELSLLAGAEREQVLVEWNRTAVEYPQQCLHELFEQQAARTPQAVAVEYEGQSFSYAELNRRANQLGHYLRMLRVGPEVRVAICLERNLEMVVALMGVLKAGGAYVPLDPAYPKDRLQFMVEDSQAAVLLTERRFAELLSNSQTQVICLEEKQSEIAEASSAMVDSGVTPRNLAYVIYTSGSTGRPKGVAIVHQSANVLMHWAREVFSSEELAGVLASTSICFDLSVFELFVPLSWGGTVLVAGNALSLPQWMESGRVKLVNTVPSAIAELLRMKGVPPSVRAVSLAGEVLHRNLVEQIYEQVPVERVLNLYGPSEDTTYSTYVCLKRGESGRNVTIGHPVANTQAYVLEEAEGYQPVPVGVVGELHLAGEGLARGYLNRPELTAEKFIPNPFSRVGGERLYRTGDRARWQADGQLEFLGRLDHQVKVRGFRIELGEIESALLEQTGIEQAVVVVRGTGADQRLLAYVVSLDKEIGISSNELRECLRARLPEYMVPAVIVQLQEMPRTPNGKLDRKALPEPEYAGSAEQVSPRNTEEEILSGIFAAVLKQERVGIEQNFFEIGGHSLLATQVISRVRNAFGVELPLRVLFEAPTVAGLAKQISQVRGAGQVTAPPLVRVGREGDLPLSFAQQRLWFLDQLQPGSAAYNLPAGIRLSGDLDHAGLRWSLQEIVRRHEALRTSFAVRDGHPLQAIAKEFDLQLEEVELSGGDEQQREAEMRRRAREEASTPFDLARGPLLRVKLLRLAEQEHVLLMTMHHIVSDGWSMGIMVREFSRLYEAYVLGQKSPLPELPVQYADYAVWQRQWLQGEVLEQQVGYWKKQLRGVANLDLPADYPRPEVMKNEAGRVGFRLSREATDRLEELSRAHGVTFFMMLLAGFQLVLGRWSGQQDVAIGTPIANRNRMETEDLIGFFANTLVLRSRWEDNPQWKELIGRIRQTVLEAYEHQDVPFEKLVEELEPERALNRSPLFQVMLILQNAPAEKLRIPGMRFAGLEEWEGAAKFDLTLQVSRSEEGLAGVAEYAAELFSAATVERLLGHLRRLLESISANQNVRAGELELLTEGERRQLLDEWNGQKGRLVEQRAVHEQFAVQAIRTPNEIAVVSVAESLTYAQLDRRSNQLGHYLQEMGAGPEVRVGVCVERSLEMVVAVLGVLKAGGAYVPLDPGYPVERLSYMLEDSGAALLVTQQSLAEKLQWQRNRTVLVDEEWKKIGDRSEAQVESQANPENLAYVIYTSGSTGKPKGVCVAHTNLSHFLRGIGAAMEGRSAGRWLALTSLSFDISILEILWTLTAGFQLVIGDVLELVQAGNTAEAKAKPAQREMEFSLFYFAAEKGTKEDTYRLLLDGARYGDQNGFAAVWTPERHFHEFGGIYANPAVTGAAVAAVTNRIEIRAGSVVLPLHDPLQVAEEWSMVDNLSQGRVALSFASGWQVNDFVIRPENYAKRKEVMLRNIEVVRQLWRGESITRVNGAGNEAQVAIFPKPVQKELRFWVTTAGNPESFRSAGESGGNLLTHLLGQSVEELGKKIAVYREARSKHGHEGRGKVSLMVHTFLGADIQWVKEKVRRPFSNYLAQSIDLIKKPMEGAAAGYDEQDMEAMIAHAFNRYFENSGLMGTVKSCLQMVEKLKEIDVDEVACLIDFGVDRESVVSSLDLLNQLRKESNRKTRVVRTGNGLSPDDLAAVTHLQCTPSMAKLLLENQETRGHLRGTEKLFLGGEQLPQSVVEQIREITAGQIYNMYGPTETTIWSTMQELRVEDGWISIGRPLGHNQVYVLDRLGQLAPAGVSGELYIGGAQVARGYLNRPELTAERFVPDAYSGEPGARMYRTGDLVRWRVEGKLDFLGRLDEQVKIRGYRIELGEIEAALKLHAGVQDAAVVAREETGGGRGLVGYLVGGTEKPGVQVLRSYLKEKLPEYMIPAALLYVEHLPLTPNGKIDRKALSRLAVVEAEGRGGAAQPRTLVEEIVTNVWMEVLKLASVGVDENFFEIGGHSLLATQVISKIRSVLGVELPLRALFETPTVAGLAEQVGRARGAGKSPAPPLATVAREGDLPVSFAQQRLWFLDQLQPGSTAYNIPFGIRLSGELSREGLRWSLQKIVKRHEVLRTTIGVRDGNPVQMIADELDLQMEEIDLSGRSVQERETEARRWAREEASTPFDLARGPLLRVKLLRLAEQDHVLLLSMHHIAGDGWSSGIMVREFNRLYEAYVRGEEARLPELPVQYADFAVWQRGWLQGEVLERQIAYWKKQLQGVEALDLPLDHPRPSLMSERGERIQIGLSTELTRALKALSRGKGVTLFMSLLAGWQMLLSRYSGQKDISVGTPIAGRTLTETSDLIGCFFNTLVLRTRMSEGSSWLELLEQVRERTLEAYEHQDLPFEKLVEELQPERNLGRAPLFQVMLVLQNIEQQELQISGLRLIPFASEPGAVKFDLTLSFSEQADTIEGQLLYARDLYEPETMKRLLGHLQVTLERMAGNPESRTDELCLLTGAERAQIVEEWNRTAVEYPGGCLHELFEEQVRRDPEAAAVEYEGERLSYGELNRRANQLGHYLRKLGIGPEVRVGLHMERGMGMVVGLLGIVKAGGAYVPLDAEYPPERLGYMLEDSGAVVVLSQRSLQGMLPECGAPVVCLEEAWDEISAESETNLENMVHAENLVYVLYTSGSTGRPKGVSVEHRQIVNYVRALVDRMGMTSSFAMVQPLAVDSSATALFGTLMTGQCLYVVSRERALDGARMAELFRQGALGVKIAPSHLSALQAASPCGVMPQRVLVIGGESSRWSWLQNLQKQNPECVIFNHYGPTETTVGVITYRVGTAEGRLDAVNTPLGRPLANTQVYVLDERMEPVPVGVAGEIYLGGTNVTRGYLNREDLTAERYVPDPFQQAGEGKRLYRTGDRGRYLATGDVEFLGRLDDQVKLRGFRVELGEIEAALVGHPAVMEAVVAVRGAEAEYQRLVAYVVGRASGSLNFKELRMYAQSRLPDYMVPGVFMQLAELPRTAHGKLDRRRLPEPENAAGEAQMSPRNADEELVCEIFAAVLKQDQVRVQDNFFELGGHSLLATQVIARIRSVFGVAVPVRALFESPTVVGLAEHVSRMRGANQMAAPPLVPAGREGDLPLSFAQQRLWFLDQLQPGSTAYNLPIGIHLSGELNREGLRWSLQEIVKRHEVLRTRFVIREGTPRQEIAEEFHLPVEEIEAAVGDMQECQAEVRRRAQEEASTPFDLARGPLVRAKLLRLAEQEHVLLVTMHHIVSDGWSMGIMVREFSRLYEAYDKGEESGLPELPVQYADFAVWQREWLQGEVLERQIGYWKKQLKGVEALDLPVDRPRPALMSQRGARIKVGLSAELTQSLKSLSRGEGVTLFMSLLAGWQVLLSRYSGQKDIAVGTPIAGRTLTETVGLIGCFVNTLVLRNRIHGESSWRELLAQVRERTLEAYEHQDVPFEKLVEELQPERDLSRQPLFQVMFGLQNMRSPEAGPPQTEMSGLRLQALESGQAGLSAKFELMLLVGETDRGLEGLLEYNTDLFDQSTAETMAWRWERVLEQVVQDAGQPLSRISLMSDAEREVLAQGWRGPAAGSSGEQNVGARLAGHAKQRPQAVAVAAEDWELTYEELNRQANQWAHYLIKEGVKPGTRVGVCLEQLVDLVVVSMGVLKSGGVLVGLDAEEPSKRMGLILKSSAPALVISTKYLAGNFRDNDVRWLCVDEQREKLREESGQEPGIRIDAHSGACVLYRSGTSGQPVGVVIRQRALCGSVPDTAPGEWNAAPSERVALTWSFAQEIGSLEMFRVLARGAQLVDLGRGLRAPRKLAALLRDQGVTEWWTTAASLESVAREFPWALKKVRQIVCEERIAVLAGLQARLPVDLQQRVCGVYGSSEAGGRCHLFPLAAMTAASRVPAEQLEAGVRLYLLGREMEPVAEGELGEIYVGGEWLALGYEPAEQSAGAGTFIADRYSEVQDAQMYRTGDWAWRRADGTLEYRGRQDGRTSVSGVRVACEEIEAALLEHEQVKAAAVVMREAAEEVEAGLVALVSAVDGGPVMAEGLRPFLQARLPEVMVPGAFIQVEDIVHNEDGAVDRRALIRMVEDAGSAEPEYVAPRNDTEMQIAAIWAEELKVDRVGRYDNFFELGGHSLMAARVIERMRQSGFDVDVRALFVAPTLAELAAAEEIQEIRL
ncbi:MAG: amino acid adenylation domain-containing protein [Acidobacteriia bacterium]|nr:amino acid adenylation domain-containing protein [Terriglobia bacterium]